MSFKIVGKAVYNNIGMGFWGIIESNGKEWLPINMPEQLKYENCTVECKAEVYDGDTIHMWGTPVKIVSFKTLKPK
jgi:hypothetical protein